MLLANCFDEMFGMVPDWVDSADWKRGPIKGVQNHDRFKKRAKYLGFEELCESHGIRKTAKVSRQNAFNVWSWVNAAEIMRMLQTVEVAKVWVNVWSGRFVLRTLQADWTFKAMPRAGELLKLHDEIKPLPVVAIVHRREQPTIVIVEIRFAAGEDHGPVWQWLEDVGFEYLPTEEIDSDGLSFDKPDLTQSWEDRQMREARKHK